MNTILTLNRKRLTVNPRAFVGLLSASLLGASVVQAQAPVVTAISPTRNASTVPRTTPVTISFDQALTSSAATQGAVRVFSQQAGGRKAGTASVSGNTLSFTPTTAFQAGETVSVTLTTAAQNSSGVNLAKPEVFQFTTATTPSAGTFVSGSAVGGSGQVYAGDLDGDGDVDLITGYSVRLNQGDGTYTAGQTIPASGVGQPFVDIDGDGDLDFLTGDVIYPRPSPAVRIYLNNGHAVFSEGAARIIGGFNAPRRVVAGDLNGDGIQDLVTTTGNAEITVFGQQLDVQYYYGYGAALGDVDNDGDLDIIATGGFFRKTIAIYLNNGSGQFRTSQLLDLTYAFDVVTGDLDRDGDLDLLVSTNPDRGQTVELAVLVNSGNGTFVAAPPVTLGGSTSLSATNPKPLLADVDGDGDLDAFFTSSGKGPITVLLNDGGAGFTPGPVVATGSDFFTVADADVDGDVDLLTDTRVYLNQPGAAATLRTPENPAGTVAGLDYQYYEASTSLTKLPDFATLSPRITSTSADFNVVNLRQRDYAYALKYTGFVTVPADGQYTFFTGSDDGSQLFIGSQLVVDNDGEHALQERSGTIGLQAGTHAFTVTYFQSGGGETLNVSYQGPDGVKQAIPTSNLRHVPNPALIRAEEPTNLVSGVNYSYYEAATSYTKIADFSSVATPKSSGTLPNFDVVSKRQRDYAYAFRFSAYLLVPGDGQYTFFTGSDDGSQLYIGSQLVVDNDGEHALQERSGTIGLQAGLHSITIPYFQSGAGEALTVSYQGPDGVKRLVPATSLFRVSTSSTAATQTFASSSARSEVAATLQVYPNPSVGRFLVQYTAPQAQAATLCLTNRLGQVVQQRTVQLQTGPNELLVEAPGQAQGLYQLSLQPAHGKRLTQKLVLQP